MKPDQPVPSAAPLPDAPATFQLPKVKLVDLKSQLPPKDWPHAPVHRLASPAQVKTIYGFKTDTVQVEDDF